MAAGAVSSAGAEVAAGAAFVFHGDGLKTQLFTLFRKRSSLLRISVIALCIIAQEHVGLSPVLDSVLRHGEIT